jgi:hypothetical protein
MLNCGCDSHINSAFYEDQKIDSIVFLKRNPIENPLLQGQL